MGKQLKQAKEKPKQRSVKIEEAPEVKKETREVEIKAEPVEVETKKTKKTQEKRKGKGNRLIIRNLVFDMNEKHIRKLMAPYGEIIDIEIPLNPDNQKCNKGFAFVEFAKLRSCEKAIKELNQTQFKGRPIVIDFSIEKTRFMTERLKQEGNPEKQENAQSQEEQLEEENMDVEEEAQEEEVEPQVKMHHQNQEEDLSRTVFVRNVPTNVTQDTLKQFFEKYGKVKWAKVVVDKETKASKGTAFIRYLNNQVAKQLIEYSRDYELFLTGKNPNFKRDPKYNLELDGTIVKVFPVEKRDAIADKLKGRNQKEEKKLKKLKPLKKIKKLKDLVSYDKQGKRNITLAQLGFWEPQEDMNDFDQERFRRHAREKVQKLKNPNNSVSDRRVVMKYLEKDVTEEQIRDLAIDCLNTNKLPRNELTYCKLMLDSERKRSAGYAFLEFKESQTAKMFVEQMAKNMGTISSNPFVVEFALQDSRKLKKLKNRN